MAEEPLPQCQATHWTDTYTALRVLLQCGLINGHLGTHLFSMEWDDEEEVIVEEGPFAQPGPVDA